jgi:hypothetical protein
MGHPIPPEPIPPEPTDPCPGCIDNAPDYITVSLTVPGYGTLSAIVDNRAKETGWTVGLAKDDIRGVVSWLFCADGELLSTFAVLDFGGLCDGDPITVENCGLPFSGSFGGCALTVS